LSDVNIKKPERDIYFDNLNLEIHQKKHFPKLTTTQYYNECIGFVSESLDNIPKNIIIFPGFKQINDSKVLNIYDLYSDKYMILAKNSGLNNWSFITLYKQNLERLDKNETIKIDWYIRLHKMILLSGLVDQENLIKIVNSKIKQAQEIQKKLQLSQSLALIRP
jgi:hypothetical protein